MCAGTEELSPVSGVVRTKDRKPEGEPRMTTQRQKRPSIGAVVGMLVVVAVLLVVLRSAEPQAAGEGGAGELASPSHAGRQRA